MFEGFANVWTPVVGAAELGRKRPLGVLLAGAPLVLFRDEQGRPAALVDRCPHRGAALSLGEVCEGRVVCPFHGWELDRDGANRHVPWNPDARRERLGVMAFPAREVGGQIWVYTGREPTEEPAVDEVFSMPSVRVTAFSIPLATHWTRAMENMLDWPHLPFVHKKTIGRSMVTQARRGRMDIELEERDYGFTTRIRVDGEPQPGRLDYRFPNVMNLFIGIPGRTLVMQVACVPETPSTSRMVVTTARDFAKLGVLDWLFRRQNMKIVSEDKAVVASSFPVEVPPAGEERSVRTDAPTLAFRKTYFTRLHGSAFSPAGEPRRAASEVDVAELRLVRARPSTGAPAGAE